MVSQTEREGLLSLGTEQHLQVQYFNLQHQLESKTSGPPTLCYPAPASYLVPGEDMVNPHPLLLSFWFRINLLVYLPTYLPSRQWETKYLYELILMKLGSILHWLVLTLA